MRYFYICACANLTQNAINTNAKMLECNNYFAAQLKLVLRYYLEAPFFWLFPCMCTQMCTRRTFQQLGTRRFYYVKDCPLPPPPSPSPPPPSQLITMCLAAWNRLKYLQEIKELRKVYRLSSDVVIKVCEASQVYHQTLLTL